MKSGINLDLVEPTGVHRGVNQNDVWPFGSQPFGGASAAM
jgi:hypothetical protein